MITREIPMLILASFSVLVMGFDHLRGEPESRFDGSEGLLLLLFALSLYYTVRAALAASGGQLTVVGAVATAQALAVLRAVPVPVAGSPDLVAMVAMAVLLFVVCSVYGPVRSTTRKAGCSSPAIQAS